MQNLTLTLDGHDMDLPPDAAVALSFRSSDLRRLDTREAAFSETFALPVSAANANALGHPHALSSQTRAPYRRLPAVLRAGGLPVLRGVGIVEASESGYEVTLLDDTADLFGRVGDKALRLLNLSALDHTRTYAAIQAASTHDPTRGYVYALADTGRLASVPAGERISALEVPASVYEAAVLRAIVAAALPGYTLNGSLLSDALWLNAVLPAALSVPRLRESYLAPWRVQAGSPADLHYYAAGTGLSGVYRADDFPMLFAQQVSGSASAFTGSAYYNAPAHYAQIDVRARLLVHNNGLAPAYIRLVRNTGVMPNGGIGLPEEIWAQTIGVGFRGTIDVNVSIPAYSAAGGRIFLQVYNPIAGQFGTDVTVYAGSAVTFAVASPALLGAPVHLETTLPDLSQADYLKAVLNRYNVALSVDAATQTVHLNLFNDLERRRDEAVDWTDKLDHGRRPRLDYRLPGYAQKNEFRYKDAPEAYAPTFGTLTLTQAATQIGAAYVLVPDATLPLSAEAYTAPLVLPALRPVAGGAATVAWLPTAAPADLADPRRAVPWNFAGSYRKNDQAALFGRAWVCQIDPFGQRAQPGDLEHPADWTAPAVPTTELPAVAVVFALAATAPLLTDEQFTAAAPASFRASAGLTSAGLSFAALLPAYHEGTARLLSRVQLLTVYLHLGAGDIAALDFARPVRLNVRHIPGYGDLQGLFYINLIDQYRPGSAGTTRVELLRLGDPVPGLAPAATLLLVRPAGLLLAEAGDPLTTEPGTSLTAES